MSKVSMAKSVGWQIKKLSIVVPCFNEQDSLNYSFEVILQFEKIFAETYPQIPYEFIWINDGSTDETGTRLESFCQVHENHRVVHHTYNEGLGAAMRTGFAHARGNAVAVIDSDCAYDPKLLLPMLPLLERHEVIDACPYHPKAPKNSHVPIHRLILSRGVVTIYNLLLRKNHYCYTCLFRVYRKSAIEEISFFEKGFLAVTEVKVLALLKNMSVYEFPAENKFRSFGQSKMKILRNIRQHLFFMARIFLGRVK